jgi:hypothetical protein
MDMRERILRKIGSWPITHWVMRKVVVAHWRRMHSAREVQKCIEACRAAAPNTVEQQQAFFAYGMALQKELEKSGFSVSPPEAAQNIGALLQEMVTGTATTSETGTPPVLELRENDLRDCLDEQSKWWFEARDNLAMMTISRESKN